MRVLKYSIIISVLMLSLAAFGVQPAMAESTKPLNTGFILVGLQKPEKAAALQRVQLFGVSAKPYTDTQAFTKWHGVLARFEAEFDHGMQTYQGRAWAKFLTNLKGQDRYTQARAVNAYFNRIKFRDDAPNWGQKDMWATPFEFMQRGGDCEDYAVAKYISLRALGVPEKQLHLTVVYDREMKLPHAVLVLRGKNGQNFVLDNQTSRMAPAQLLQSRYQPIFGLNQTAWWHYGV